MPGIKPDGTFRFEDIPQGKYLLEMTAYNDAYEKLGTADRNIIVEPMKGGRSDEPMVLDDFEIGSEDVQ